MESPGCDSSVGPNAVEAGTSRLVPTTRWLGIWLALLCVAVFVTDLQRPVGFNHSLLYVMVVVLALGHPRSSYAVGAAAAGTVLCILGFALSPPGGVVQDALLNRGLATVLMWITAALVVRYQRTEEQLSQERREAQAYLDIAAVAIVVLDKEGKATLVNKKGCEILEREPAEVLGRNWFEHFVAERYREASLEGWRKLMDGRTPTLHDYLENIVLTKSGKERILAWHRTIMRDASGAVSGTLSSGADITDRRRAEELSRHQQALAQLGQMAAVVAHQVRNPLAGIKGAIQIIGSRLPQDNMDRQVISSILDRVGALNDMTRDLLTFARPRPPCLGPVSIRMVLRDAASLLSHNPEYSGAQVSVTGADCRVMADAEMLKDGFLNLFLNAAQAMDGKGSIAVSVTAEATRVRVAVADTGPGVPQELADRVFEPFVTTKHRGSGLGLSIVKSQVEAHGGELHLSCPSGGGTVVSVVLPVVG